MAKPAKVIILGDAKDAAKAFRQIRDEADKTENRLKKVGDDIGKAGKGMTIGVTVPLVALGKASIDAAVEAEEATARMESSFDSMGATAWTSMERLTEQADTLGNELTTVGDEAVLETQARMLTFGNITGEVFDRSIMAAIDFGEKMGTDAASAAMQLGKAINDPVKGMTALTKQGITFTAAQKEVVKQLVASGDTMAAQDVILDELERQFGGTAEAMAATASGQAKQAMNELGEAGEAVGAVLLPVLAGVATKAGDLAKGFGDLNPETQETIVMFGGAAAAAGPLLVITGKLVTAVNTLKTSKEGLIKVLGSPWTGAFALAAGVAVGFLAIQKENADRTDAWTEALSAGTAALNTYADEVIAAEIVNRDLSESMDEAGVSAVDVKNAILGNAAAFQEFVAKLSPAQSDLLTWVESQRIAREKADEYRAALDEQETALGGVGAQFPIIGGALQGYITATDEATESTGELEAAAVSLAETQRAAVDPLFNLISANERLDAAQQSYNEVLVEFGPTSDEARQSGIELAKAQLDLNDASTKLSTDGIPASIDALYDMLVQAGLTEEMIRSIIDSIHDLNATPVADPYGPYGQPQPFNTGGVVGGRRGAPQLILAHGGETVLPTHRKSPVQAYVDQFGATRLTSTGHAGNGAGPGLSDATSQVVNHWHINLEGTGDPGIDAQRVGATAAVLRRMETR